MKSERNRKLGKEIEYSVIPDNQDNEDDEAKAKQFPKMNTRKASCLKFLVFFFNAAFLVSI